jgi:hypothetical protein
MNEIQLIRSQLATEREHARTIANTCAAALARAGTLPSGSPLELFRQACVDYLVCVLAWFEERDQRLADLSQARLPPEDPGRRALEGVLARRGRSREALEKLEAAFAASPAGGDGAGRSWREFAQYFNGVWSTRRDAIDALLAPNPRVADWRALGGLDADSVLEERRRYARVCAALPAGLSLTAPSGEGP